MSWHPTILRRVTEDDDGLIVTKIGRSKSEWAQAIDAALKDMNGLDNARLDLVRKALLKYRDDVTALLRRTPGDTFNALHRRALVQALDREAAQLDRDLRSVVGAGMKDAAKLGRAAVADPIAAVGAGEIGAHVDHLVPVIDTKALALSIETSGDLITGLTADLASGVRAAVGRAIVGQVAVYDTIKAIAGELDKSGVPTPSVFASRFGRAETIARTEINGAFSRSTNDTISGLAANVPGLFGKRWVATKDLRTRPEHRRLGTLAPIDAAEKYVVNGIEADGPHDPALPPGDTINCRCSSVLLLSEHKEK